MSCLELVSLAAASWALLRGWFLSDGLAARREWFRELRNDDSAWRRRLGYLMTCPPCLIIQLAVLLSILFILPGRFLPEPWDQLIQLPVWSLAAAGLVPVSILQYGDQDVRRKNPHREKSSSN